jgi:hypothetical protein
MPQVRFTGAVVPSVLDLSINMPPIRWTPHLPDSTNFTAEFKMNVASCQIEVICDLNRYDHDVHFPFLHRQVHDITRAAVDCFSFSRGIGATVYLHTFTDQNMIESPIVPRIDRLAGLCTAFDIHSDSEANNYNAMVNLVLAEPPLFLALNDLVVAIALHDHAPVSCARAVESLRHVITPTGVDSRKLGWILMQTHLNVKHEYLSLITDNSQAPRHGDRKHSIPASTVQEIIDRSWVVMKRFLEFRKRGSHPLPVSEFPVL